MDTLDKKKMLQGNLFMKIMNEKCPNCGRGNVFKKKEKFIELPVMKEDCDLCHYHFDREPGYFLGAMYVSYGMAVLEGIIAFLIASSFIKEFSGLALASIVVGVIVVFSIPNFKFSRIIWMYIFPYKL